MDPCPYVRVLVGNLALKIPVAARSAQSVVHPSSSPCFCRLRLHTLPYQTVTVPLVLHSSPFPSYQSLALAADFNISRPDLERLPPKSSFFPGHAKLKLNLELALYTGRRGTTCGVSSGRLLGRITILLDLNPAAEGRAVLFHSGWVSVGKGASKKGGSSAQVHVTVRAEPDPRFVFEFGGEPERSPQVFQLRGPMRQPVFTLNFSCRNSHDHSRSFGSEPNGMKNWLASFGSERERPARQRKGWSVAVHDLSGSPVALASMVTPFVASPGMDRVGRSNPGAWLVLRPGNGTWKPWGRLECWRERGGGLGHRFELLPDTNSRAVAGISLAESVIPTGKGGQFTIDLTGSGATARCRSGSPGCSAVKNYHGFVMSSTVGSEGRSSRPTVEVGVNHVACTEDAAVFVALAAAIDLSMDACRLFPRRRRKELKRHG